MKLKNTFTPFKPYTIASPDKYNYYIKNLKEDLDDLFIDLDSINTSWEIFRNFNLDNKINSLMDRYRVLNGRFESLRAINSGEDLVYKIDLMPAKKYDLNSGLYKDPKSSVRFTRTSVLEAAGSLSLPVSVNTAGTVLSAEIVYPGERSYLQSAKNYYIIRPSADSLLVDVIINIDQANINYLSFNLTGHFPLHVKTLSYISSGNWIDAGSVESLGVSGTVQLRFSEVSTTKLKLTVQLYQSRVTNRTLYYSEEMLINSLLQNNGLIEEYPISTSSTSGQFYIFHLGIESINCGLKTRLNSGVFVSPPKKLIEPAHFALETTTEGSDAYPEYYIYKQDFNNSGLVIEDQLIPVLPKLATSVNEVLIINSLVASLSFYPDATTLVLKKNGSVYAAGNYTFNSIDNTITFVEPGIDLTAFYTAEYTPLFRTNDYPTPLDGIDSKTETVTLQPDEGSVSGSQIIFTLPFVLDPNEALSVTRYINDIIDAGAPVIYTSGINKNIELDGRTLKLPYDSSPKLDSASYVVEGVLYGSFSGDDMYYYNHQNQIMINWDMFSTLPNYAYSYIYLVTVLRKHASSDGDYSIKSIELNYRSFNDLI